MVALTGWLVVTPTDGSRGMWIVWGALLVVMPVVAAATDPVVTVRRVLIRAAFVAVTFPLVAFPAIYVGLALGFFEFAMAGGQVGVDGLPIYPIGMASAGIACAVCAGVTRCSRGPSNPRSRRRRDPLWSRLTSRWLARLTGRSLTTGA